MADTNLPTPKPARKPKPKVRALKEHKPCLRIDVEKAESLLKELDNIGRTFSHKAVEFEDLLDTPLLSAANVGEAIDPNLGEMLKAFRTELSDWLMRTLRGRDTAITAMKGAVSALRLLRTMRENNTAQEVDV